MYLSHLMIDVGDNPDRPRPGRLWLRNLYRVHQRLAMAFPSDQRRKCDPEFLAPYKPEDFPEQRHLADQEDTKVDPATLAQVHTPRSPGAGFLFRVDPLPGGRVAILVLSGLKPDWDYAFGLKPGALDPRTNRPIGNAGHLLAAPPSGPRPLELTINSGSRFHFRLTANPVRKASRNSQDAEGQPLDKKWVGKHVPVPSGEEHLRDWLERRAEPRWTPPPNGKGQPPGFRLVEITGIQTGYVYFNKTRDPGKGQRLRSARYEGVLEVTNPDDFRKTLIRGIGPAKAFGFGLLSVAPG